MNDKLQIAKKRNFGVFTEASKALNKELGDESGRTVSMRTAHGFKTAFKLDEKMDDNTAEDIVHVGMAAAAGLLSSKDDGAKVVGGLLLLGLVSCYQNGK